MQNPENLQNITRSQSDLPFVLFQGSRAVRPLLDILSCTSTPSAIQSYLRLLNISQILCEFCIGQRNILSHKFDEDFAFNVRSLEGQG